MSKEKGFCIICKSSGYTTLIYKNVSYWEYPDKFQYFKCKDCGLLFQTNIEKSKLARFYDDKSYWSQDLINLKRSGKLEIINRNKFGSIYEFITCKKGKGSIFDIGAGSGSFLSMFDKNKWDVSGFDVSRTASGLAKRLFGVKIMVSKSIADIKIKKKFDFITMLNSIEHIAEPEIYLKKANLLLKKDGYLIIQIPNISSLGFWIFGTKWYPLQPGRHLYDFNPSNIKSLLNKNGFKTVKIVHFNKEHTVYGIFQSIRYLKNKKEKYTSKDGKNMNRNNNLFNDIKKQLTLIAVNLFSYSVYLVGALIGKGDYITVYATKKN